jgi:hypothetical protein
LDQINTNHHRLARLDFMRNDPASGDLSGDVGARPLADFYLPTNVGGNFVHLRTNGDFPENHYLARSRIRANGRIDAHWGGLNLGGWSIEGWNLSFPTSGNPSRMDQQNWLGAGYEYFILPWSRALFPFNSNHNFYVDTYRPGMTIFTTHYWGPGGMLEAGADGDDRFAMWQLLQNSTGEAASYSIRLEIENAEQSTDNADPNYDTAWTIYATDFNNASFNIAAEVIVTGDGALPSTAGLTYEAVPSPTYPPSVSLPSELTTTVSLPMTAAHAGVNVRSDFVFSGTDVIDGGVPFRDYIVTAESPSGRTHTAHVRVMVRQGMNLM